MWEDTSLSQQKGQVQQHSTPRAEDLRALGVPLLLPFPFQKMWGRGRERVKTNMPVKKVQHMFRILVKGNKNSFASFYYK